MDLEPLRSNYSDITLRKVSSSGSTVSFYMTDDFSQYSFDFALKYYASFTGGG